MKALVAYYSQTGNTKKVARAIFDALDCEKEIMDIKKVKNLDYDLVFFGCPVQPPYPPESLKKYLGMLKGKTALFLTHAAPEGAPTLKEWIKGYEDNVPGKLIGTFDCQGQLFILLKLFMLMAPKKEFREWARHDNSNGQPDKSRINKAAAWAKKMESMA